MFGIAAASIVLAVFTFYIYRKFYCHRVFKRLGIPGPEPHWLYGNIYQLFTDDRHLTISKWSAQYGPFYGFYHGAEPVLVVSSIDAVENLLVKQFADFNGRMVIPVQPDPDREPDNPLGHMLFARGETWKRLRTICNPAFTTGKLKSYMSSLSRTQRDLIELMSDRAKSGQAFDIRECYQYLTLEVIGQVAFGVELECIKNKGEGNNILKYIQQVLKNGNELSKVLIGTFCLPEIKKMMQAVAHYEIKHGVALLAPASKFAKAIRQIVAERRKQNYRHNDVLQMMMDAREESDAKGVSTKTMTETELVAQCFVLFVAGYETTSTSLGFASYLLAKHPDVQEKLAAEIAESFPHTSDGSFPEIDYETAMNLPYLDWVVKETLRLYPVGANILSRYVEVDSVLCGVSVPKSVYAVHVDTWTIHHDESRWGPVDTSKFYPERFSPEYSASRPESAYLPFGFGPRICIGMRLALMEMKVTIINLMLRFQLKEPNGGYPGGELKINSLSGPLNPVGGRIPVILEPRQ